MLITTHRRAPDIKTFSYPGSYYKFYLNSIKTWSEDPGCGQGISNYQQVDNDIGYLKIDVTGLLPVPICECGSKLSDLLKKDIDVRTFDFFITKLIFITKYVTSVNITDDTCKSNVIYVRTPFYDFLNGNKADILKYDQNRLPCFLHALSLYLKRWLSPTTELIKHYRSYDLFIQQNSSTSNDLSNSKKMKIIDLNQ